MVNCDDDASEYEVIAARLDRPQQVLFFKPSCLVCRRWAGRPQRSEDRTGPARHCCVRDGEQRLSCLAHESRSLCRRSVAPSAFTGFRFPPEVITLAVRWYLRFGLSYRDVEELLAERGIEVDPSRSFGGCSASHRC